MREVIAVDIDEVLFPFVQEFVAYDNQRSGGELAASDFFCYRFEHVLDISLEEAVQRVYSFNGAPHDHISPIAEAQEAIAQLGQSYDLSVVTARHPQFEANTERWLNRYMGGFFSEVVHVGYAAVMERPQRKVDVCQRLGAVALIDDSVEHVSECAEAGLEGVLFGDYEWNQVKELPGGVTRCKDWRAVLEYFDGRD